MIKFIDKETGLEPVHDTSGKGFYVGADGMVYELIDQCFCNHVSLNLRPTYTWSESDEPYNAENEKYSTRVFKK